MAFMLVYMHGTMHANTDNALIIMCMQFDLATSFGLKNSLINFK